MAPFIIAICSGILVYVLIGYPLLLGHISKRSRRGQTQRSWAPLTVSVLLAVRNGERFLAAKLDSLLALDYPADRIEIFVLSDGSTDRTAEIAEAYRLKCRNIHFVDLPTGGKSASLNAGLERASGEILFFTDVRQPLDPASLRNLVAYFADPEIGVVSGELIIRDGTTREEAQTGLYWKYEKRIRLAQSKIDSVIGATGAIYAQRRRLARPLPTDALLDDVHQPLNAFFAGYRVILAPEALAYDVPTNLDQEFRRKTRTLAGNYQVIAHFPKLFSSSNRMRWHFLSHKFGRLLLPFALIGIGASSFFVCSPWSMVLLSAQALFYLIAWMDPFVPDSSSLKRLSSPIRTFTALMAATLLAGTILFRSAKSFWR